MSSPYHSYPSSLSSSKLTKSPIIMLPEYKNFANRPKVAPKSQALIPNHILSNLPHPTHITTINTVYIHPSLPSFPSPSPFPHSRYPSPRFYNSLPTGPNPVLLTTFFPTSHAFPSNWNIGGTGMVFTLERWSWMSRRAMLVKEAREKMEIVSRVSRRMLMCRWVVW